MWNYYCGWQTLSHNKMLSVAQGYKFLKYQSLIHKSNDTILITIPALDTFQKYKQIKVWKKDDADQIVM